MEDMALGKKTQPDEAVSIHTNCLGTCFLLQHFQIECKSEWIVNVPGQLDNSWSTD